MLEYHRIDESEGIDVNKNQWFAWGVYYLSLLVLSQINFGFQRKVCDRCHDLIQKVISFNDVAIVSVKGKDYKIHLFYE